MTNNKPFFSVIVLTFNRNDYLRDVLASLTKQTRTPDEVIVVDNGINHDTESVVLSFQAALPIKYVQERRRGIPFARNTGVRSCSGELIAFIDDDCAASPDWLKNLEKHFLRDPNIGAVGGDVIGDRSDGTIIADFVGEHMKK
jgi:glycosyltransferase involved in cell wall biosynthesis